jgi:hypothetical protein
MVDQAIGANEKEQARSAIKEMIAEVRKTFDTIVDTLTPLYTLTTESQFAAQFVSHYASFKDVRAVDQGRQGRDQVDAVVMPDVRRQCGAAPASCARLQSRQFSAHAGNAGADQGLVTDELEGEAHQDRCEGGEPWSLCRLPDGRGRHPTANVPGDFAPDRGTTTATATSASMKRSIAIHSTATDGRSTSKCQAK